MPISNTKTVARSQFLGAPPLVRRDNEEDYKALHKQAEAHIKPDDFLGDLMVRELTDAIWEGQRFKRYQAYLTESAFHTALVQILTQIYKNDDLAARHNADKWYSGNKEDRQSLFALLQQFGFNIEMVYGVAMSLNAPSITMLERMISNRKSSRTRLLKDHDRLQKRIEEAKSAKAEVVVI